MHLYYFLVPEFLHSSIPTFTELSFNHQWFRLFKLFVSAPSFAQCFWVKGRLGAFSLLCEECWKPNKQKGLIERMNLYGIVGTHNMAYLVVTKLISMSALSCNNAWSASTRQPGHRWLVCGGLIYSQFWLVVLPIVLLVVFRVAHFCWWWETD